jgi:hypothetical protein
MKPRRSFYARPEIIRGQQCAEAPLDPRRSDQAAAGETLSRAGRRPHRRACMGCRAPQAPSTRTRLGVPARGRSAWWPKRSGCRPRLRHPVRVLGQRPVSSVRCPVRATSVHACLSTGPVPSVRCGRLSVQVSAVRRPVSASGVGARCLCVAVSAVSGRSEVLERGGGAGSRTAGMARVGVVARCIHDRLVVCLSRSLVLEAGAGGAGPAEASVWTWPSSWEVVGLWPAQPRGRPGQAGCTRGSFVGRDPVRSEARLLRQADRHAAGESLGRSGRVEPNIKKPIGHISLAK